MKRSVLICILMLIEIVTYAQIDSVSTSNYSLEDKEIVRVGEKYLYLGETYKSKQMPELLSQLNYKAGSLQFNQGKKMTNYGWLSLGIGLALDATGVVLIYGLEEDFGIAFLLTGGLLESASIPLFIVGYFRMHNAVDEYNQYARSNQSKTYWSINVSPRGLGVAYNF